MKRTIWQTAAVASGFLAIAQVSASDVFVGARERVAKSVAQGGSVVQSDRIAVSSMGELKKTGGGAWTVASPSIFQHWPFTLTVEDGTFSFGAGSGAPPANTQPSILDSAALWVAADDPDATHLDKSGNGLSTWYDVRETDVSSPKYMRAKSDCVYTNTLPSVVEKDGLTSVYFGGMGSGIAMRYYAPGATSYGAVKAYHLFAVVGFYATQGAVFGSGGKAGNAFMAQTIASKDRIYADQSRLWNSTARAIVNVDGERCDPYADKAPSGRFHLFDMATPYADGTSTGAFFGQWGSAQYWGGDYLAEAIIFTNRISATDHDAIQSYLSHKWFGAASPVRRMTLAKGATYAVNVVNDQEVRNVVLTGEGTVEKTGGGTLFYRTTAPQDADGVRFAGSLDLAAGAADLSTSLPLAATGGQTVETSVTGTGNVRTVMASGPAETFVKTGTGTVAVAGAPAGARKIMVQGGTLDVRPSWSNTVSRSGSYEIPITNPSFETYATDAEFDEAHGVISIPNNGPFVNGWRRRTNAVWIFNWAKWTDKLSFLKASRTDYNQSCPPLDGDVAVFINFNGYIETEVTIPETGLYELSFDVYNRQYNGPLGCYAICTLVDEATGTTVADFGRAYYYEPNYRRVALRAQVSSTGTFLLRTRACNQSDKQQIIVDNFALRRVGEAEQEYGVWKVPNGDFEYNAEIFGNDTRNRVTVSPFANWTFDQGSGIAGITTMAVTNTDGAANVECNGTRGPYGGFRQLLMKANACSATVTATPPVGKWFVRADVARYFRYNGTLSVSAAFGGNSYDLGSVPVNGSLMKPATWPVPFVVDGSTSVELTFSFARSEDPGSAYTGAFLDDVRLVPCNPDTEYLTNAGFETQHSTIINWGKYWDKVTGPASGTVQVQPYSYKPDLFSADRIQGGYFIYLERDGGAAQDVTFDQAGWYRLSFYAALSRMAFENGWYKYSSPVRAWLAQGAVTNVIGNTGYFSNTNYCQYVWDFKVPAAGTYTFAVQGTETNKGYNACLDALSIRRMDGEGLVLPEERTFAEDTIVQVDEGARLRVAFEGTNAVKRIVLGGKSLGSGVFNVADYPGYLDGYGTFLVKQRGVVIGIR